VWPEASERAESLRKAREKIVSFRSRYPRSMEWSRKARSTLQDQVDEMYRDCQKFATTRIRTAVEGVLSDLGVK
jgi:hypothetical protein